MSIKQIGVNAIANNAITTSTYHYYMEVQLWLMRTGDMRIITVNFQKRHRGMLERTYMLMSKRYIKIHPSLQKLIVSLQTAVVSDEWKLDKQQTSHDDILNSFRLALRKYASKEFLIT